MRALIAVLALLLLPATSVAQTPTPVTATSLVSFAASANHATTDRYDLEIVANNGLGPIFLTKSLGKPTPTAANDIVLTVPELGTLVAGMTYRATVIAVNTAGSGRSAFSNPFVKAPTLMPPAPPGTPRVGTP